MVKVLKCSDTITKLFITIVVFSFSFQVYSSNLNKVDSLLNVLRSAPDSEKAAILNALSNETLPDSIEYSFEFAKSALKFAIEYKLKYEESLALSNLGDVSYFSNKMNDAEDYYQQSLLLSIELRDTSFMSGSYDNLGYVYLELAEYKKALESFNKSLKYEKALQSDRKIASVLNNIGLTYDYLGKYKQALEYYLEALQMEEYFNNDEGISNVSNNIGNIYLIWGNYDKALYYYLKSLKIHEKSVSKSGIAIALNNIGIIYHNWKNYDKALEYYQKALKIEDDLDNKQGMSESLNNIAIIYDETGEYNKAIDLYKKSLEIEEEIGNKIGVSTSMSNIGEFYEDRGNYNIAFDYYNKSIKIDKEIDNSVGLGQTYNQLGNLYVQLKQYNKAIKYYNHSRNIVEPLNIIETIIENYKGLGDVYSEIKDYKKAIYFINKYHSLKDSIFSKEMLNRQSNLQADFEIEKKEKEIELLNSEKIIRALEINEKQSQLRGQKTLLYISFGGIVLFIVFILLLFRQIKNRNKAYKLLTIQNKEIKENRLELIAAKEKAEGNEIQLNAILENSPTGFTINRISTGEVTYVNKAFTDAYHIPVELCSTVSSFFEYVYGDQIDVGNKILEDVKSGIPERIKWDVIPITDKKTKNIHHVTASNIILKELDLMISTVVDITSQINSENELKFAKNKAEESDRLKSAFLANISHEIRTPMNGILGFAELLKEPDLTGDQQIEYIDVIQKGGARMLNIINDIVNISRIESNIVNLSTSETNINNKIEYIHSFFKVEADKKQIKLDYKAPLPTDEASIIIDREKIYAILTNLVKNAIKFTKKGSIEFGYTKKGNYLEFYVKDTGIGIPINRLEAIFKRFIQADIEDTNAYQGAGLGLAISKAYIEMMNGTIWVESEFGKGSTFYFTIPYMLKSNGKQDVKISTSDIDPSDIIKNLKVLLVEDDEVSMDFLKIIMAESKTIITAYNGAEAVEVCKDNSDLDLILMDIKMPIMDGFEATKEIRLFNKDVVIIAQTAYGLTGDRKKAIDFGCNNYISKPLVKNVLFAKICECFTN